MDDLVLPNILSDKIWTHEKRVDNHFPLDWSDQRYIRGWEFDDAECITVWESTVDGVHTFYMMFVHNIVLLVSILFGSCKMKIHLFTFLL